MRGRKYQENTKRKKRPGEYREEEKTRRILRGRKDQENTERKKRPG